MYQNFLKTYKLILINVSLIVFLHARGIDK